MKNVTVFVRRYLFIGENNVCSKSFKENYIFLVQCAFSVNLTVFEIITKIDVMMIVPYATIVHCFQNIIRDQEKKRRTRKKVVIEFRFYAESDLFYPDNVKLY
jgi:hypothetical protein